MYYSCINPLYLSHSHREAEAAATHGAPELAQALPGSTRGVEALRQQHDAVEKEKGGQAIDDILEILNAGRRRKGVKRRVRTDRSIGFSAKSQPFYVRNATAKKPTLKETHARVDHLHIRKSDVVLQVTGKVGLDEPLGLGERLVPTATEQGDARETQQGGDQGAVRDPTQTAHTAVIATCSVRSHIMRQVTLHTDAL